MLIIGLLIVFSGCTEKQSDLLVGKWEQVFDEHDPLRHIENWEFYKLTFYRDGTGSRETHLENAEPTHSTSFTYKLIHDGSTIHVDYTNTLTSPSRERSEEWAIIELDDKKMKLKFMEEMEFSFKKVH